MQVSDPRPASSELLGATWDGAGVSFALRETAWGRHLYATGDDREASNLAGISTNRVLLSAYVVAG